MLRNLRYPLFFVTGIALAVFLGDAEKEVVAAVESSSSAATYSIVESVNLSYLRSDVVTWQQRIVHAKTTAEKKSILFAALDSGTLHSLELFQTQFLSDIIKSDKDAVVELKQKAIDAMLSRFSATDWRDWPNASTAVSGGPTDARRYVDDVFSSNPDVGAYLETAALLFYGMYTTIGEGKRYDVAREFVLLRQESGDATLAPAVLRDNVFNNELEKWRLRFVIEYLRRTEALNERIPVVFQIQPDSVARADADILARELNDVSINGSRIFRATVFDLEQRHGTYTALAAQYRSVKRALASFYATRAVDEIEENNAQLAERLLARSNALYPGLRSQELVLEFLERQQMPAPPTISDTVFENNESYFEEEYERNAARTSPARADEEGGEATLDLFAGIDSTAATTEDSSQRGARVPPNVSVGIVGKALMVIAGMFIVFLALRKFRVRSLKKDSVADASHSRGSSSRAGSTRGGLPGEVDFYDAAVHEGTDGAANEESRSRVDVAQGS